MAAEQHDTSKPFNAKARLAEVLHTLNQADDDHIYRAGSLAMTLSVMASSPSCIDPKALGAISESLEDHIRGLEKALDAATELLRRSMVEAAAA